MNDLLQRTQAIKLAIFDVDGVLTDGKRKRRKREPALSRATA